MYRAVGCKKIPLQKLNKWMSRIIINLLTQPYDARINLKNRIIWRKSWTVQVMELLIMEILAVITFRINRLSYPERAHWVHLMFKTTRSKCNSITSIQIRTDNLRFYQTKNTTSSNLVDIWSSKYWDSMRMNSRIAFIKMFNPEMISEVSIIRANSITKKISQALYPINKPQTTS